jgi:hypothetical protein
MLANKTKYLNRTRQFVIFVVFAFRYKILSLTDVGGLILFWWDGIYLNPL